jgi:hypothetical protein
MAGDDMAITIKVVGSSGVETQFQVKKFTKMEQIFEEYAGNYTHYTECICSLC